MGFYIRLKGSSALLTSTERFTSLKSRATKYNTAEDAENMLQDTMKKDKHITDKTVWRNQFEIIPENEIK